MKWILNCIRCECEDESYKISNNNKKRPYRQIYKEKTIISSGIAIKTQINSIATGSANKMPNAKRHINYSTTYLANIQSMHTKMHKRITFSPHSLHTYLSLSHSISRLFLSFISLSGALRLYDTCYAHRLQSNFHSPALLICKMPIYKYPSIC